MYLFFRTFNVILLFTQSHILFILAPSILHILKSKTFPVPDFCLLVYVNTTLNISLYRTCQESLGVTFF